MMTYVEYAQNLLATYTGMPSWQTLWQPATYTRPSTGATLTVRVLIESYTHNIPQDIVWIDEDRTMLLPHTALSPWGTTAQYQDVVTVEGKTYQVQRVWEDAPRLVWAMQVRPWS